MRIQFYLRFHTEPGHSLGIAHHAGTTAGTLDMSYLNGDYWQATLEIVGKLQADFRYQYFLKNKEGEITRECGWDKVIEVPKKDIEEIIVADTWNYAGEYENVFYTA